MKTVKLAERIGSVLYRPLDFSPLLYILLSIPLDTRLVMSVRHALLGILAQSPRHGYDLKRTFDDKLGDFWSLNFGQIYTTLDRLQAEGLITYDPVPQDDKPDKKVYSITAAGRTEFDQWRTSSLKAEPRVLRDELFLRLLFMEEIGRAS